MRYVVIASCQDVRTGKEFEAGDEFLPEPDPAQALRLMNAGCLEEIPANAPALPGSDDSAVIIADLRTKLGENASKAEGEYNALNARLADLTGKHDALVEENSTMRGLLDGASIEVDKIRSERDALASDNTALLGDKETLTSRVAELDQERAARQRLIAATRKGADSEEEKENATAEAAEVERTATRTKIADQLSAKKITGAQADQLNELNEATYTQRLQNILVDRATRTIDRQYETAQGDLQSRVAILRINQDMATTAAERRRIGQQILEAEQELRRQALERTRDTSQDPKAVQSAKDELGRLPKVEEAEKRQFDQQPTGQLDEYRKRLRGATDDMNDALQGVAVQGFGALESSGSQAIGSAVTNLFKLRGVAGEVVGGVISDLARLAIQKAIVSAIGGSFFGLAGGGEIGGLPGFAEGGSPGGLISGPGTGTSDSILAILGGGKGAIRVSTKEFIVNAAATQKNLPLLHAINSGRTPGFAQGGYDPRYPRENMPRYREHGPTLPQVNLAGGVKVDEVVLKIDVLVGQFEHSLWTARGAQLNDDTSD